VYLKPNRKGGHVYWNVVESVSTPKGPRQKILMHLGKLEDDQVAAIKLWLKAYPKKEDSPLLVKPSSVHVRTTLLHGGPFLPWSIADELDLVDLINEVTEASRSDLDVGKLITAAVVNRCVDPVSKSCLVDEWLPKTSLPLLLELDLEQLHNNAVYRAMDVLLEHKTELELALWNVLKDRYGASPSALFYDITSSYFEGEGPPLARRGYSRDKRPDRPQVNIGLVITEEGYPITSQLFPGNTLDKTTVEGTCSRLKEDFAIESCVFVGDRGMITDPNLEVINSYGYNYIICHKEDHVRERLAPVLVLHQDEWEVVDEKLSVLDVEHEGQRFVLCYNARKAEDDRKAREAFLEKGRALIEEIRDMAVRGTVKDHDKLLKKIVKRLVKKNLDGYFDFKVPPTPARDIEYWVIDRKVENDALFDGKWVLQTDVQDRPAEDIARMYKRLSTIEDAFRTLKGELEMRPMYHRLDERVFAHVFICQLAYLVMEIMARRARENRLDMTAPAMVRAFSNVTLNEVTMGPEEGAHVWRVTELDEEQRTIMLALEMRTRDLKSLERVELTG
jgi:transposase